MATNNKTRTRGARRLVTYRRRHNKPDPGEGSIDTGTERTSATDSPNERRARKWKTYTEAVSQEARKYYLAEGRGARGDVTENRLREGRRDSSREEESDKTGGMDEPGTYIDRDPRSGSTVITKPH